VKLADIAAGNGTVSLPMIGGDRDLAREIQTQLGKMGLLDPPADGLFGPVSHWALAQVLAKLKTSSKTMVDASLAKVLLEGESSKLFPLKSTSDLAGRIVSAARASGHWLCRHPDCVNIIYVEGMNEDGTLNDDAPNVFNDLRIVLRISRAGKPGIVALWEATSEPGRFYTVVEKLDPRGAARIAFGQYKAWSVGTHMAGRPSAHEALVQTAPIKVFRDFNEDFERNPGEEFEGVFGVNQHWGYNIPRGDIGRASAGCLVGRTKAGHREFMSLCKADPRFTTNNSYRFMTAVLPASAI
jgi:hypothetical protein